MKEGGAKKKEIGNGERYRERETDIVRESEKKWTERMERRVKMHMHIW